MQLCTFSKSEVYAGAILPACPLDLKRTECGGCLARKRIYVNDLRLLSCEYPNDFRGRPIEKPTAVADRARTKTKEKARTKRETKKLERMIEMDTTGITLEPTQAGALVVADAQPQPLPLVVQSEWFDRVPDPIVAARTMGEAFAASAMFGVKNTAQGFVLALACLTERRSPLEIVRKNHVIGGTLTMKADAMLAEFRARGGSHDIVERSSERAAIKLTLGKKSAGFAFAWNEAKGEEYVYMKDGKTLKDNWSTPRRRMQMLWARVVSDAVRAFCPEVCAGVYCPEEISGEVYAEPQEPAADVDQAAPRNGTASHPAATPQAETAAPKPVAYPTKSRDEMLAELRQLKTKAKIDATAWPKFLAKFGVKSALELDGEQLPQALADLRSGVWQQESRNELDQWASEAALAK